MAHLIFGLLAISAGLFGVFAWWDEFGLVFRGLLPITLLVFGLLAVGAGLVARAPETDGKEP